MSVYYNEFDPKAAAWLQELMTRGLIPAGVIDTRSIEDVRPIDLVGFTQCHFFAGIGGWPLALEIAGVTPDRRVWTGSCPCQPFSAAGRRKGFADDRHLWPAWCWLIEQLRPPVVFGEQVSSPAGRDWLDVVRSNLAAREYSTGAADLCAAGVGAPHIRQRLYWVAHADEHLSRQGSQDIRGGHQGGDAQSRAGSGSGERISGVADANGGHASTEGLQRSWEYRFKPEDCGPTDWMGNPNDQGPQGRSERRDSPDQRSPWEASLVDCRDGKRRPVEPGTFPLAHGIPGRVGLLRGYGNAIVPQVAAEFIKAALGV